MGHAQDFLAATLAAPETADCILWPYATDEGGYGKMIIGGKTVALHRHVCRLRHGEPEGRLDAAHNCGVRNCINAAHIEWKTRADNCADRIGHGTENRGERHGSAKLTREDVRDIRRVMAAKPPGKHGATALARKYGIAPVTLHQIVRRRKWQWLD